MAGVTNSNPPSGVSDTTATATTVGNSSTSPSLRGSTPPRGSTTPRGNVSEAGNDTYAEGYPLHVSIPRAEVTKGRFKKHATYMIELDDCGKVYTRARRYANFHWLHSSLRNRFSAESLPELPPKRMWGNLEHAFVEQRRQILERYLGRLLEIEEVVADDTIWTFLDADIQTVVVLRFLCKASSRAVAADRLAKLQRHVLEEANLFRLRNRAVLHRIVEFARSETVATDESLGGDASQGPLDSCLRVCVILQPLMAREISRQTLVEADLLGVLLAMVKRAIEEEQALLRTGSQDGLIPNHQRSQRRAVRSAASDCLRQLLESSKGSALLRFCEHNGGLTELRRLAESEVADLHQVAATLLWQGLVHPGVLHALVDRSARCTELLGTLLVSSDQRSCILAALCLCGLLRHTGYLEDTMQSRARESIAALAAQINVYGDSQRTGETPDEGAGDSGLAEEERGVLLKELLRSLCRGSELRRLVALLCLEPPENHMDQSETQLVADEVSEFIVVIFDAFAWQNASEPTILEDLSNSAPQLQKFLLEDGAPEILQMRVARILLHLRFPTEDGSVTIEALARRTRMLQILEDYSARAQDVFSCQAFSSRERSTERQQNLTEGDLTQVLCIGAEQLMEFCRNLANLEGARKNLDQSMSESWQCLENLSVLLEERSMQRGALEAAGDSLRKEVLERCQQEVAVNEIQKRLAECETRVRSAKCNEQEQLSAAREAEVQARKATEYANEAAQYAMQLWQREADLVELCKCAPSEVERLQHRLQERKRTLAELIEDSQRLASEAEASEQLNLLLQGAQKEAETALQRIGSVLAELRVFKQQVNSELILSDEEMARLRKLETQLPSNKPARIRQPLPGEDNDQPPPEWSDLAAENEYHTDPNFRTFSKLCFEREELWGSELRWVRARSTRLQQNRQQLGLQKQASQRDEMQAQEDFAALEQEIRELSNPEGLQARLEEARATAAEAQEVRQQAEINARNLARSRAVAEELLEQKRAELVVAEAALAKSHDEASVDLRKLDAVRSALRTQELDLEEKMRDFLHGEILVRQEQRQLDSLLDGVDLNLRIESESRGFLRTRVRDLANLLGQLDVQLDVGTATQDTNPFAS